MAELSIVPDKAAERQAKLAKIKEKTPRRVGVVVTQGREFYIVGPTRTQWHQFKEAAVDTKRRRVAMENLAAACCVDPTPELVQPMFEDTPALAETLSEHISVLAGYDDKAELVDFEPA